MFDTILGIPMHPLLVHAVVIFVPLQVLAAVAYALVPFVRRYIAWAVAGLAVITPLTAYAAKLAGDTFRKRLGINGAAIDQHQNYGGWTLYASAILSVLMILLLVVYLSRARRQGDDNAETSTSSAGSKILAIALTVGVLGMGGVALTYVVLTGHSGAKIVWGTR